MNIRTTLALVVSSLMILGTGCSAYDTLASCRSDSDCSGGYRCTTGYDPATERDTTYCYSNCGESNVSTGSNDYCQPGYACVTSNTGGSSPSYTHQCELVTACDITADDPCRIDTRGCSPTTHQCVTLQSCTTGTLCPGHFVCDTSSGTARCPVNCAFNGTPDDNLCGPGYHCAADFTCVETTTCSTDGYVGCNTSDFSISCDAATHTCMTAVPCTDDSACTGPYHCSTVAHGGTTGYCLNHCLYSDECKTGYSCNDQNACAP